MRLLLALAAYAALTVSGFAQTLQELDAIPTFRVYTGETRVIVFDQGIADIKATGDNVKIIPESDRTFAFVGASPGTSILSAFDADGKLISRVRVVVPGGLVRMYGTQKRDATDEKDYVGYICTDVSCGRADPELERQSTTSVSRTRRTPGGDIVTTTRGN